MSRKIENDIFHGRVVEPFLPCCIGHVVSDSFGVYGDHDALAPEFFRSAADKMRVFYGSRIDGYFVAACPEQVPYIVECFDAAADGQGHKDVFGCFFDNVKNDLPFFMGSGDIEENEFIGALLIIEEGIFNRISCIAEVDKTYALYNTAVFYVQAGDYTFGKHTGPLPV